MKKFISLFIALVLSMITTSAATIFAVNHNYSWDAPILPKSELPWAKYSCKVTTEDIKELTNIMCDKQIASDEQIQYYDQNFDGRLTIIDLIILKNRCIDADLHDFVKEVTTEDLGYVSLYKKDYQYTEQDIKKYDLDCSGDIGELDFLMLQDFYVSQYPELDAFGGCENCVAAISMVRTYEKDCKKLMFYTGDIAEYPNEKTGHTFVVYKNGEITLAATENDGSLYQCIILGYHYTKYLGPLDAPTDWYAVIN